MFGAPAAACNCAIPCCVVAAPIPVCPALCNAVCSSCVKGETCISGKLIGLSATLLAISINSSFRSSIPGASLTKLVVVLGGDPPPPRPPPPKKLI